MSETRRLAAFVAETGFDDLATELIGRAKVYLLDNLAADGFPGSARRPLDFGGAADKLRRYAAPLVGETRVDELVELVRVLERLEDVTTLARTIRA